MEMIEFTIKNSFSLWDGRVLAYAKDCLSSEKLNYLYLYIYLFRNLLLKTLFLESTTTTSTPR